MCNGLGLADRVAQLGPRVGQDRVDAHDRIVDTALGRRDPEHLHHDMADLVAREPEHARQHRDVRLKPRPVTRQRRPRQLGQHRPPAPRTRQPHPRVLEHQRPDWRQLVLLMADRIADRLLAAIKHMPAAAALRQMLKPPIDALGRDHLPALALMTGLGARATHRSLVSLARQTTTLRPRLRWI